MACRAICHFDKALIANKRMVFDDVLKTFDGIKFFFSCITGTTSHNSKSDGSDEIRYGISYYVVFTNTERTDVDTIFAAFHDNNLETTVTKLKYLKNGEDKDRFLSQLSQVVKVLFTYSYLDLSIIIFIYLSRNSVFFNSFLHSSC